MTTLKRIFTSLTPYDHFLAFLIILTIMKIVNVFVVNGKDDGIEYFLLGIGLIVISTVIYLPLRFYVDNKKGYKNLMISVLIIVLILSHAEPEPIRGILIILLLFVSKFIIKYKKKNIFNPVIFSVSIVTVISFTTPSIGAPPLDWTGIDIRFPIFGQEVPLPILPIILALIFNVGRLKKHPLALSFVIVSLGIGFAFDFFRGEFISYLIAILFVAAAIIVEPKTSPTKVRKQLMYGIGIAITIGLLMLIEIPNAIVLGLFASNIVFFVDSQLLKPVKKNPLALEEKK